MNGEQEVKVSGPGGSGASVKGQNVLTLVILAAALGGMLYVEHEARSNNVKLFERILGEMRAEHAAILGGCKGGR